MTTMGLDMFWLAIDFDSIAKPVLSRARETTGLLFATHENENMVKTFIKKMNKARPRSMEILGSESG